MPGTIDCSPLPHGGKKAEAKRWSNDITRMETFLQCKLMACAQVKRKELGNKENNSTLCIHVAAGMQQKRQDIIL